MHMQQLIYKRNPFFVAFFKKDNHCVTIRFEQNRITYFNPSSTQEGPGRINKMLKDFIDTSNFKISQYDIFETSHHY